MDTSQIIQPGFPASNAATILSRAGEAGRSAVIESPLRFALRGELRLPSRPTVCLCIGRAPGNHPDLPQGAAQNPGHLQHEGGRRDRPHGSHWHANALGATGLPVSGAPGTELLLTGAGLGAMAVLGDAESGCPWTTREAMVAGWATVSRRAMIPRQGLRLRLDAGREGERPCMSTVRGSRCVVGLRRRFRVALATCRSWFAVITPRVSPAARG